MVVPAHRGLADLVKVMLNPRLLMVYVLLGGSALRGWRQRQWRAKRRERRHREREERVAPEGGTSAEKEATDEE
jgi:hypothetical protein